MVFCCNKTYDETKKVLKEERKALKQEKKDLEETTSGEDAKDE